MFSSGTIYEQKLEVARDSHRLISLINKSLMEIKDLLKNGTDDVTNDSSLSALKDKDLIKIEAGARKNNNQVILRLIEREYRVRGLFIMDDQMHLSKEGSEKVTVNRLRDR